MGEDFVALEFSRSTAGHDELSGAQQNRLLSEYQELTPSERNTWLDTLAEGLSEVDARLQDPTLSIIERENYEASQSQIRIMLNAANRSQDQTKPV